MSIPKNCNIMKRLLAYTIAGSFLLSSCGGGSESGSNETEKPTRIAKGDVALGGSFNLAENEKYNTLFPYEIKDAGSAHIAWQIFEGLVRMSQKDLSIQPSIAESWEVSDDQKEYVFHLRKDVRFHDDPCFADGKGRLVTATDIKFSLELACTKGISDQSYELNFKERLEGAQAFYNGEAKEVSGVEVVDDYTVKIRTIAPSSAFLYILANPVASVIPKEGYEKYGKDLKIGTGAFKFSTGGDAKSELILVRKENYYRVDKHGNQLPYLDTVHIYFVNEDTEELDMFREGELSMIYGLPAEKISEVVQENIPDFTNKPPKYILLREPEMSTQFYELNLTRPQFKDVRVRRALSMAIDRSKIMENVLNGQAAANGARQNQTGNYGLVPPLYQFSKYDTSITRGYTYNPEMAKKLMAQAGYPGGKGFPTLKLLVNYGGSRNTKVASEVMRQWRDVLGINIELEQVSLAQKIEDSQYGRADIYRSAWVADYPSPESFLSIAYGKNVPATLDLPSHPNTMRYKSAEFDKYYELGMAAKTEEERYANFAKAESIMMQDCPVIIIWYVENYRLLHSSVHNFHNNPMSYFDLSDIYLKAPVAEKPAEKKN
ncbi:MAG TPA: ABC transporter substrate-binding protein [Flavobacteriales bacterium]|nr:ABC transporter substrate-binding protein [Flavobacteriales bacterium]